MAPTQCYPRSTVKRIVKAHSNRAVSKNVDIWIYLNYMLFVQNLMREAGIHARASGERGISARTIRKVRDKSLMKFRG